MLVQKVWINMHTCTEYTRTRKHASTRIYKCKYKCTQIYTQTCTNTPISAHFRE